MFIYDLVDVQELTEYLRLIEFERFTLERLLPNVNREDLEFAFTRGRLDDQDATVYRAFDTPAPIARRQGVSRVRGELPPLSRKIQIGEEERLRLRQLQENGGAGANNRLVDQIYRDAENMARAINARLELARGEALYTGKLVLAENGVKAEVDYGMPAGNKVSAAVAWSNFATADPLGDLLTWMEAYVDETDGATPGEIQTSTKVKGYLLRNEKMQRIVRGDTERVLNEEELNNQLRISGLPPISTYDTKVRVNGVSTRTIPEDRLLFLPDDGEPLGETQFGVTAESMRLVAAGQLGAEDAPGLVAVIEETFDPVATWTKAAAIALPVLANPELVLSADVF